MSVLSFVFEGIVAALMVAMIVYCIRLDRRLGALRQNDAPIRALIGELQAAAERAEGAVGHLKAAGLDAERSLQQAIRTAQAVEDDLVRRGRFATVSSAPRGAAEPPVAMAAGRQPAAAAPAARREARSVAAPGQQAARQAAVRPAVTRPAVARPAVPKPPDARPAVPRPAPPPRVAAPASSPAPRSEAERELLRAIRFARSEGEA